jgi:hypothetical protein
MRQRESVCVCVGERERKRERERYRLDRNLVAQLLYGTLRRGFCEEKNKKNSLKIESSTHTRTRTFSTGAVRGKIYV